MTKQEVTDGIYQGEFAFSMTPKPDETTETTEVTETAETAETTDTTDADTTSTSG